MGQEVKKEFYIKASGDLYLIELINESFLDHIIDQINSMDAVFCEQEIFSNPYSVDIWSPDNNVLIAKMTHEYSLLMPKMRLPSKVPTIK